ncbi:MAG: ribosome-associated translation inhibitor RaiA [Spirochaetia bacterium]|jgi:putative sigma-54 modulation protein|nr:ribosome-associated translation inhibitor RaiA [Spirochaetia bacterium]MCF7940089.1 ribosome-associated translation inhibitor RaiA [Spirochaetia bacterium]
MHLDIQGIHYNVSDTTQEFIQKKLERIDFAKDYVIDLSIMVIKEPHGYMLEGKIHFQWSKVKVVSETGLELYEVIELFVDKLERVIRKEKGKVKEH